MFRRALVIGLYFLIAILSSLYRLYFEPVDYLPFLQGYDCFSNRRRKAFVTTDSPPFFPNVNNVYANDVNIKYFLNGFFYLNFINALFDFERIFAAVR